MSTTTSLLEVVEAVLRLWLMILKKVLYSIESLDLKIIISLCHQLNSLTYDEIKLLEWWINQEFL